jgi:sortase A
VNKNAHSQSFLSLRSFNNILSVIVALLCLYVILAPLWPQVQYQTQQTPALVDAIEKGDEEEIPDKNTLVIPRMKLQQEIHEGGEWVLNEGVWHTPDTGDPASGSNMVLSGHRFTYGGPAVFYHMDKVQMGDKIVIFWQKQKYEYEVKEIKVVPPTAVDILSQTGESKLTIYTCTPLWSAADRLVVVAELMGDRP